MSEWVGITLIWILLYGYLIVASIDFGAGFFASYETISGERHGMNAIINRVLSPFWETISVIVLILLMTGVYMYSSVARHFGAVLFVPSCAALILILLRVLFYVLKEYGNRVTKALSLCYGLIGLVIPVVLSSILTISEGGFIDEINGHFVIYFERLMTSFYSWSVIALSIVSVLYISAMFLSFYANRVGDEWALEKLRGYAIFWSGPTVLASGLVFAALQAHNPEHFMNSLNVAWLFLLSLVCLLAAVTLVFQKRRLGLSFILAALQYFFAFFGYGISHLPYIIYPYVKLAQLQMIHGFSGVLVFSVTMGLALLLPSLILVARLVVFNRQAKTGPGSEQTYKEDEP